MYAISSPHPLRTCLRILPSTQRVAVIWVSSVSKSPVHTPPEAKASWVKAICSGVASKKEGPWGEGTLRGSEHQEGKVGSSLDQSEPLLKSGVKHAWNLRREAKATAKLVKLMAERVSADRTGQGMARGGQDLILGQGS